MTTVATVELISVTPPAKDAELSSEFNIGHKMKEKSTRHRTPFVSKQL